MNQQACLTITVGQMSSKTDLIADKTVGGHFAAAQFERPLFDGAQERASHAGTTIFRINPPPFDIADRIRFAADGMRMNRRLNKAAEHSRNLLGHENDLPLVIGNNRSHLTFMALRRTIGP